MLKNQEPDNFDFEAWASLAKDDPERFEAERASTIEAMITSCPQDVQQHLRRMQWRVDRTRELKKTPMSACIAISEMMWDSLHNLNRSYLGLSLSMNPEAKCDLSPLGKATVLPFRYAGADRQ